MQAMASGRANGFHSNQVLRVKAFLMISQRSVLCTIIPGRKHNTKYSWIFKNTETSKHTMHWDCKVQMDNKS